MSVIISCPILMVSLESVHGGLTNKALILSYKLVKSSNQVGLPICGVVVQTVRVKRFSKDSMSMEIKKLQITKRTCKISK